MTYQTLNWRIRELAEAELTEKQLEAWQLELEGWGLRTIAWKLDISRGAVADRLESAHRTLRRHGVRQNEHGHWHLEEAA